jgi:hypothetical protein
MLCCVGVSRALVASFLGVLLGCSGSHVVSPPPRDHRVEPEGIPQNRPLSSDATSAPAASNITPTEVTTWTLQEIVPIQLSPSVPGTVVGLLWTAGQQPWGAGYEHNGFPSTSTDHAYYKFGFDGSSPYAMYFVSDGRGKNFIKNWTVPLGSNATLGGAPGTAKYDAAVFEPTTPNPWGLSRTAHVVELEVNDKRGGTGIHLVITRARVIDGTPAFLPRADDVLIGLRQRFNVYLAVNEDRIRKNLDAEVSPLQSSYGFGTPFTSAVGVFPTWDTNKKAIDVVFTRITSQSGQGTPKTSEVECTPCPPGAACVRCVKRMLSVIPTAQIAVYTAARYVVDKSGQVIGETHYAPIATKKLGQREEMDR